MNPIKEKSLLYRQLLRGYKVKNVCDRYNVCKRYATNASEDEINMLLLTLNDADWTASLPEIKIGIFNITHIINFCKVLFAGGTIRRRIFLIKILEEVKSEQKKDLPI